MRIHVTDRHIFKRCRRRYQYQQEGLVQKHRLSGPLWFGTGMHTALAAYYKDASHSCLPLTAFRLWLTSQPEPRDMAEEGQRQNDIDLAEAMLSGYASFAQENDTLWEIVSVEKGIEAGIPGTSHTLVGTQDLIIRNTSNGKLWVVDHKTYSMFPNDQRLETDDQMTAYIWLCREAGVNVAGAIYNVLRKKIPAQPELLKTGRLSKSMNIDTTPEIYRSKIKEYGLEESDYMDILLNLEAENRFYRRFVVPRTSRSLASFQENLIREAEDMSDFQVYPNFTTDCVYDCPYRTLCQCETEKGDIGYLKELEYEYEQPRSQMENAR